MHKLLIWAILAFGFQSVLAAAADASVAGTWDVVIAIDSENHDARITIQSDNGALSGKVRGGERELPLKELKLSGDTLTFVVDAGEHVAQFLLKVSGDAMEGSVKVEEQTGTVKGKKQPK